jgi:hypothetical protein
MALSSAQKTEVRRHCGYPLFGNQPTATFGYRYFTQYGTLEYRMTNMSTDEEAVVVSYLANLTILEAAIPLASANLDTDRAAVWFHNKNELQDRDRLYGMWCKKLLSFFGIPPGPGARTGISWVV